jgi:molybdopterin converting factor small subunit
MKTFPICFFGKFGTETQRFQHNACLTGYSAKKRLYNVLYTSKACQKRRLRLKVTVDYLGSIKQTLELKQPEQMHLKDDASLVDLLSMLAEKHGDAFKKSVYEPPDTDLKPYYILSLNGVMLNQLKGLETPLKDGDHVTFLPVVTGG